MSQFRFKNIKGNPQNKVKLIANRPRHELNSKKLETI